MQRPPAPKKSTKGSSTSKLGGGGGAGSKTKFVLNAVQRVQVEIIDGKRCAVRACLLISYVTLLHFLTYLTVVAHSYPIIRRSKYLSFAFYGFFIDLGLYFFGSGAALKAITYSWRPLKFCLGITAVILGLILNVGVFFVGTTNMHSTKDDIFPVHMTVEECMVMLAEDDDKKDICSQQNKRLLEISLQCMALILPPVSLVCVICAGVSAYKAVYLTPLKLRKGQVDAVWLEPYETYDFYVGRVVPRTPGYDEKFGDAHAPLTHFFDEDEDSPLGQSQADDDNATDSVTLLESTTSLSTLEKKKQHRKSHVKVPKL